MSDGAPSPDAAQSGEVIKQVGEALADAAKIIEASAVELAYHRPHPDPHLYDIEATLRFREKRSQEVLEEWYYGQSPIEDVPVTAGDEQERRCVWCGLRDTGPDACHCEDPKFDLSEQCSSCDQWVPIDEIRPGEDDEGYCGGCRAA